MVNGGMCKSLYSTPGPHFSRTSLPNLIKAESKSDQMWEKREQGSGRKECDGREKWVGLKLKFHRICQLMGYTIFRSVMDRSGQMKTMGFVEVFTSLMSKRFSLFATDFWKGLRLFFILSAIMCAFDHISYYRTMYSFCAYSFNVFTAQSQTHSHRHTPKKNTQRHEEKRKEIEIKKNQCPVCLLSHSSQNHFINIYSLFSFALPPFGWVRFLYLVVIARCCRNHCRRPWCCLSIVCSTYWPTTQSECSNTKDVRKLKTHTLLCHGWILQYWMWCDVWLCLCMRILKRPRFSGRKLKRSIEFSAKWCWWLSWWQSMCALLSSFFFLLLSVWVSPSLCVCVCYCFCSLCLLHHSMCGNKCGVYLTEIGPFANKY